MGAPRSFQSGISSLMPRGSMTAPEMMCAPISLPFSRTAIEASFIELSKMVGGSQTGGPAANNQNIDFKGVAFGHVVEDQDSGDPAVSSRSDKAALTVDIVVTPKSRAYSRVPQLI